MHISLKEVQLKLMQGKKSKISSLIHNNFSLRKKSKEQKQISEGDF